MRIFFRNGRQKIIGSKFLVVMLSLLLAGVLGCSAPLTTRETGAAAGASVAPADVEPAHLSAIRFKLWKKGQSELDR